MGVIFTDHIANDAGGLFVRLVEIILQHIHCKQHPPMYGL
jgi:hypothetical protein